MFLMLVKHNSFLTIGKGQRIGLIAGSGVGKSTGDDYRFTEADIVVIGLIGERQRGSGIY